MVDCVAVQHYQLHGPAQLEYSLDLGLDLGQIVSPAAQASSTSTTQGAFGEENSYLIVEIPPNIVKLRKVLLAKYEVLKNTKPAWSWTSPEWPF